MALLLFSALVWSSFEVCRGKPFPLYGLVCVRNLVLCLLTVNFKGDDFC